MSKGPRSAGKKNILNGGADWSRCCELMFEEGWGGHGYKRVGRERHHLEIFIRKKEVGEV